MHDVESGFLETELLQALIWYIYIENFIFIWTHREQKLQLFLIDRNNYNLHIKFTFEFNKEHMSFLNLNVTFSDGKLTADWHAKE